MLKYRTVYFVCNARLPKELPASKLYDSLALGAKVDITTGDIIDVSCTLLSPLALEMVKSYLIGRNIIDDIDEITEEVEYRHQGLAQKAIIKGILEINKKYIGFCKKNNISRVATEKVWSD